MDTQSDWVPMNVTTCVNSGYQIYENILNHNLCYKPVKCDNSSEVIHATSVPGHYICGPPCICTNWADAQECSLAQIIHPERWTADRPVVRKVLRRSRPARFCGPVGLYQSNCTQCETLTSFENFGQVQLHDGSVHVVKSFSAGLGFDTITKYPEVLCYGEPNSTNIAGTQQYCDQILYHTNLKVQQCASQGATKLCLHSGHSSLIYKPAISINDRREIPIRAYATYVETEFYEYKDDNVDSSNACRNEQIIH
ncbi:hypothetical protein DdX_17586 [Ditylenchus destructor]|uniref:Uncharacterized protein n=1 Tax=Ditylenchus destructor TaxID=166010 RepID=A0AAD4QYW2_9BILA|nr:hypothetical protein DdX_17586 [Ditylenchus destructor]